MAIVAIQEVNPGRSHQRTVVSAAGVTVRKYVRVFQVICDSMINDPTDFINDAALPAYGATYVGPNAQTDTNVKLIEKSAEADSTNPFYWRVTCEYMDFASITDNNQFVPRSIAPRTYQKPLILGWRDPGGGAAWIRDVQVKNSAGDPFDPAPHRDESMLVFRATRHKVDTEANILQLMHDWNNKTNNATFKSRAQYTWKSNLSAELKLIGATEVWQITYELEYNPDTWLSKPIQRGYRYKLDIGGGSFKWCETKASGQRPSQPFLLKNSTGELLTDGTPVEFGTFYPYEPKDFSLLGI